MPDFSLSRHTIRVRGLRLLIILSTEIAKTLKRAKLDLISPFMLPSMMWNSLIHLPGRKRAHDEGRKRVAGGRPGVFLFSSVGRPFLSGVCAQGLLECNNLVTKYKLSKMPYDGTLHRRTQTCVFSKCISHLLFPGVYSPSTWTHSQVLMDACSFVYSCLGTFCSLCL